MDSNSVEAKDIGVNFFFQPNDIGKSRTDVMVPKLRELNPLCSVASAKDITEALIKSHSAVVITQPMPLSRLIEFNEICRVNSISFFYCDVSGVFLDIFVDHGINHTVFDFDGERPIQKLITDVTPINESECLIRYETPEGQQAISISKGHYEVSEVQGIDGMNGSIFPVSRNYADPVKTVRAPYAFKNGNGYQGGGLLTEKKLPTPYPMQSLAEKMFSPGNTFAEPPTLVLTDLINFGAELQQHVAFYATFLFEQEFHRLPVFGSEEDIEAVFQLAKKLVAEKKVDLEDFEVDETFVKKLVKFTFIIVPSSIINFMHWHFLNLDMQSTRLLSYKLLAPLLVEY